MKNLSDASTLGRRVYQWIVGLAILGSLGLLLAGLAGVGWGVPATVGWFVASLMGASGWWCALRAVRGGPEAFMRYVLGGMFARMVFCGILTGVVVGAGWLEPVAFVSGLLGGLVIYLAVEVSGLVKLSGQASSSKTSGSVHSPEGAQNRG